MNPIIKNGTEYIIGYFGDKPIYRKWLIASGISLSSSTIIDSDITSANNILGFGGSVNSNNIWDGVQRWASADVVYSITVRVFTQGVKLDIQNYTVKAYNIYVDYVKS